MKGVAKIDNIVTSLLNELNLDSTDGNTALITSLVNDANDLTLSAISPNSSSFALYQNNQTYIRAVKTLATQLFYDRTLANGTAKGYRMMVAKLQAQKALVDSQ